MATEALPKPPNIKFWAVLIGVMLAVSVLVMLIDMSIKAAILGESAELRRVILNERERQEPGNTSDNSEYNIDSSIPGNLLVPTDTGMGKTSSPNGHKATTPARRATRQVPARDPEIPSRNE